MTISPRVKLLLLLSVFIVPMIFAAILYLNIDKLKFNTTNVGELITPPQQSQLLELKTGDGNVWQTNEKWTIVYYTPGFCDNECVFNLGKIESVRMALGREVDRAQTALISTEMIAPSDNDIINLHLDPLVFNKISHSKLEKLFAEDALFIIDPHGFIILRYPQDTPGNAVLRDMRHLLKVSRIG